MIRVIPSLLGAAQTVADDSMAKPALLNPKHPERICWGCEKFCPADSLACGNGTIRTPHPSELFGDDWLEWEKEKEAAQAVCGTS